MTLVATRHASIFWIEFADQWDPKSPWSDKRLRLAVNYALDRKATNEAACLGFSPVGDAALNSLNAVGIRMRMRPMERAAFYAAWQEKKLRGLFLVAVGNSGNAVSRVESFIYSKGASAYGGYPDIDELFQQQGRERNPGKREALLHRIQQLTIDRVMFAPLIDLVGLMGVGPRLADHALNSIPMHPFPAYEDMRLKNP